VVGTDAVRKRQGPQAARDGPLPQQGGFVDIAIALEAGAGEIRIAKEGKNTGLQWLSPRQGRMQLL
jgi:hypothetical protein